MQFLRPFVVVYIILFLAWLVMSRFSDLLIGIVWAALLALIAVGWCYAFFLLMNTKKWYYELFAVLMTGIIGAVILLALQWVYHKARFTFFD